MSHLTTSPTCEQPATALRPRGAGRRLRRGYISLLAIMLVMIGIVTLMPVVNWTYLILASHSTLRLSDTLTLTAVRNLLDEQVLSDTHSFPATEADDIAQANSDITTAGTGFLAPNNATAAPTLRPTVGQLTITRGRVDNAAAVVAAPSNFTTTPVAGQPHPRREFPIYSNGINDPIDIVDFVGARVISTSVANEGNGQGQGQGQGNGLRLRVRLQPNFIIHSTVETQRFFRGETSVPENLYIHKIRLTR